MVEVDLKNASVKSFSVSLHDPIFPPRGIFIKTLGLLFGNDIRNGYQLGFQKITTRKLPKPFKDACINYNLSPFETHFHCLDECINEKIRKTTGKYHPYLLRTADHYREDVQFINVSTINYADYHDACESVCPENCTTTMYNVVTVDSEIYLDDQLTIVVDYLTPNIDITYRARLTLEEYLIYIGSILSLWFGWCIHATPVHVFQSIQKVTRKNNLLN